MKKVIARAKTIIKLTDLNGGNLDIHINKGDDIVKVISLFLPLSDSEYTITYKEHENSNNAKIQAKPVSAIGQDTKIDPIRATSKNKDDVYRLLNVVHSMAGTCAVAKVGNWQLASSCSEENYTMTTWTNGIVDVKAVTINGEDHTYSLTARPKGE
jgi:hypothetical protein